MTLNLQHIWRLCSAPSISMHGVVFGHKGIIFHTLNLSRSWKKYVTFQYGNNSLLPLGAIIGHAPRTNMQIKNCYTKTEPVTFTVYAYIHVGYNDYVW